MSERNEPAATRLLEKFEKAFHLLAQNPKMGRSREELVPELRSFPVDRYLVFYKPLSNQDVSIEVIRVLHGARDLPPQFN